MLLGDYTKLVFSSKWIRCLVVLFDMRGALYSNTCLGGFLHVSDRMRAKAGMTKQAWVF